MRLVLASTSPARLTSLRAAGIDPLAVAPGVDEDAVTAAYEAEHGPLAPPELVQLLATAKAEAVLPAALELSTDDEEFAELLVLGGDSVFVVDGLIQGKPHTVEVARARWRAQRGSSGRLHSGHRLIRISRGEVLGSVGAPTSTLVRFVDDLDDEELAAYLATGEPLEVAGAFTIDSLGAAFIEGIDGEPSTVVGLSIPALRRLTRELGVSWPSLWNRERGPWPVVQDHQDD